MISKTYIDRSCMVYKCKRARNTFGIRILDTLHINKVKTYRKKVCVVGNAQLRITSSVVVTVVHVMQRETTWPASNDRVKLRVHKLVHRLQTLEQKASRELYSIGGRTGFSETCAVSI